MDPGLARRAGLWAGAIVLGAMAVGAAAQEAASPTRPSAGPPAPTAAVGASPTALPAAADAGSTQPSVAGQDAPATAPAAASGQPATPDDDSGADDSPRPPKAPPAGPPTPLRAPSAVLRVLDKVTAETMAFDAPIGRRVRFKSLVFEVKACETSDLGEAQPQPAAYLLITSDAGFSAGPMLAPRQLFKGWMFATAPGVHALAHPVYDAWLVSCSTAAPAT